MDQQSAFNQIIREITAYPEFKYVKFIHKDDQMYILGKYGRVARPYWFTYNDRWQIRDSIILRWGAAENLSDYISQIISALRRERAPQSSKYRRFYIANFPCLATEADYEQYKYDYEENIQEMLDGAGPLEQICVELFHWDLLAFERKVHAALDGSRLPQPICEEIFSLFMY